MRGQILSPEPAKEDPTNRDQENYSDANVPDDTFNVDKLLMNMKPIPKHIKDTFGSIDEFSEELEAAKVEFIKLEKEEKIGKLRQGQNRPMKAP